MTDHSFLVFGVGLLVLASGAAGPALGAPTADSAQIDWPWEDDDDEWSDDFDLSEVSVSAASALDVATNETNGTAVELELGTTSGTPAYDILTVGPNGVSTVVVDATNGSIVRTSTERRGQVDELSGIDLADLRSASEAVQIAQNETNGTVTEVNLQVDEGPVFYEVELHSADGTESTVFVDVTEGPVLGVQTEADGS